MVYYLGVACFEGGFLNSIFAWKLVNRYYLRLNIDNLAAFYFSNLALSQKETLIMIDKL